MNEVLAARLDLISAKAKILATSYREGKLWEGDLSRGLDDILREVTYARNERGASDSRNDWMGDR